MDVVTISRANLEGHTNLVVESRKLRHYDTALRFFRDKNHVSRRRSMPFRMRPSATGVCSTYLCQAFLRKTMVVPVWKTSYHLIIANSWFTNCNLHYNPFVLNGSFLNILPSSNILVLKDKTRSLSKRHSTLLSSKPRRIWILSNRNLTGHPPRRRWGACNKCESIFKICTRSFN